MHVKAILFCLITGIALFTVTVSTQRFDTWAALLVVLLLVCPLLGLWVEHRTRDRQRRNDMQIPGVK